MKERKKLNYKIEYTYETLWKSIIRPPRDIYEEEDLIDFIFIFSGKTYTRKDYDIVNERGQLLSCSFIEPVEEDRPSDVMPVVIYLHGNSSSRLEGLRMAPSLLKRNINLFVFDFSGSGLSEGEYISLGYYEKDDVRTVVDFVSKLPGVGSIGLWGRSMGAATAMMYTHTDKRIKCSVYDSPFMDFRLLAKQLCNNWKKIPFMVVDFALIFVKKTIFNKIGVDIDQLQPINDSKETFTPGFFVHAMKDELIPLEHSVKLFDAYMGEKSLNVCEGGHNTKRKRHIIDKIGIFLLGHLTDEKYADDVEQFNKNRGWLENNENENDELFSDQPHPNILNNIIEQEKNKNNSLDKDNDSEYVNNEDNKDKENK